MGFRHCEPCGGAQKVKDGKCSRCNKPFPDTSTRAPASEPVVINKRKKIILPSMKVPPVVVSHTAAQQLDVRLSEKGKEELSNADDSELLTPPISPPTSPRQVHSSQADTTVTDRSTNVKDSVGNRLPLRFNSPEDSTTPVLTSRDEESLARFLHTYRRLCLVGYWVFKLIRFILIVCGLLYVSVKMYQNGMQCYNTARNYTIVVNMTPYFDQMEKRVSFIGNTTFIPSLAITPWTGPIINFTEKMTSVGDRCLHTVFEHFANFTHTNATATLTNATATRTNVTATRTNATATLTNATATLTNSIFTNSLNTWPTSWYIATVGLFVAVPAQVPPIGAGACAIGLIEAVPQVAEMVKDHLVNKWVLFNASICQMSYSEHHTLF